MTQEQREAFVRWAENEAHGAINLQGDFKKECDQRIRAGFDVMRNVFPTEEDWLGTVWERLMH